MGKLMRAAALALASLLAAGALAACDNNTSTSTTSTETSSTSTATNGDSSTGTDALPYEGVTLKLIVTDTQAEGNETKKLVELIKERTGITIDLSIIPNAKEGEVDKRLVSLQAGDSYDLIYGTTAQLKTYYSAGVLTQLDDLAASAGYDFGSVFREDSLAVYDGGTYGLPAYSDIWLTYINTKWFEDANIEIPSAEGWTWEKYEEVAQQITDAKLTNASGEPVWGSYMSNYNNMNYLLATQKGAEPYKADGTANFDDPLYKEAMEWYNGLGARGLQPDIANMMAGTYAWNQFLANDDMAMFVCGGWVASMFSNIEQYPRDWEVAILPLPYPEGYAPSTLSIPGCYAIPSTTSNPEAALAALKVVCEEIYTLGEGRIPARIDLSQEEINAYIQDQLLPNTFKYDPNVTIEDISTAWFNPGRAQLPEKIIGTADTTINKLFLEQGNQYGIGAQDLDTTMNNIQEGANKAIEEELASRAS